MEVWGFCRNILHADRQVAGICECLPGRVGNHQETHLIQSVSLHMLPSLHEWSHRTHAHGARVAQPGAQQVTTVKFCATQCLSCAVNMHLQRRHSKIIAGKQQCPPFIMKESKSCLSQERSPDYRTQKICHVHGVCSQADMSSESILTCSGL